MTSRRSGARAAPAGTGGPLVGYAEVLGAAVLWGSSGVFSVHLFRMGVPPESVALLRPVLGLALLAALLRLRRRRRGRPDLRGLAILAGVGGLFTGTFQVAYQVAIDIVGVPSTVALLYLAPALVVAASGPILGEWPSPVRVLLAAVSVGGVWLTIVGARGVDVTITPAGLVWGAVAGASYAGYTLFGRYASPRYGSAATVVYSTAGACVLLAGALPALGVSLVLPPHGRAWAVLLAFALLTIAAASFLFYDGLGRIEASRASIASTVEPVVAALLATAFLGQHLTAIGWVGLGLVVVGVAGAYGVDPGAQGPPAAEGAAPPGRGGPSSATASGER